MAERDFRNLSITANIEEEQGFSKDAPREYVEKAKKLAKKQLKEEGMDIDKEELYTVAEILEGYYESASQEVPDKLMFYMNIAGMLRDDILSGYVSYIWFGEKEAGGNIAILYYTQ